MGTSSTSSTSNSALYLIRYYDTEVWVHLRKIENEKKSWHLYINPHALERSGGELWEAGVDKKLKVQILDQGDREKIFLDLFEGCQSLNVIIKQDEELAVIAYSEEKIQSDFTSYLSLKANIVEKDRTDGIEKDLSLPINPYQLERSLVPLGSQSRTYDSKILRDDFSHLACLEPTKILELLKNIPCNLGLKLMVGKEAQLKVFKRSNLQFSFPDSVALSRLFRCRGPKTVFSSIARQMVDLYVKTGETGYEESNLEIANIAGLIDSSSTKRVIERMVNALSEKLQRANFFGSQIMPALTKIFIEFRRSQEGIINEYFLQSKNVQADKVQDLINGLKEKIGISTLDLPTILHSIVTQLEGLAAKKSKTDEKKLHEEIINNLNILVIILETRSLVDFEGLDINIFEGICKTITPYKKHQNLEIAYLASFAYGLLLQTPPKGEKIDKKKTVAGIMNLLRGVGTILENIDLDAPWHVFGGVMDAIPEFKEAIENFKEAHKFRKDKAIENWFGVILGLRKVALRGCSLPFSDLEDLRHQLSNHAQELLYGKLKKTSSAKELLGIKPSEKKSDEIEKDLSSNFFNHRFFTMGLVHLIRAILRMPNLGSRQTFHLKHLLNSISERQKVGHKGDFHLTEESDRTSISAYITETLTSIGKNTPTKLFLEAYEKSEPTLWRLAKESYNNLAINSEADLKELIQDGIPIKGQSTASSRDELAENTFHEFLKSDNRILMIGGERGCGKSFLINSTILKMLASYDPDGPHDYLPIKHSMSGKKGYRSIMKALRENHPTFIEIEKDKVNAKVVFFLDALEEARFEIRDGQLDIKDPILMSKLKEWTSSKIVITCRSGFCDVKEFQRSGLPFMQLNLFQPVVDPREYCKRYLQSNKSSLTYEDFIMIIDKLYPAERSLDKANSVYRTPIFMKAMLIAMPGVLYTIGAKGLSLSNLKAEKDENYKNTLQEDSRKEIEQLIAQESSTFLEQKRTETADKTLDQLRIQYKDELGKLRDKQIKAFVEDKAEQKSKETIKAIEDELRKIFVSVIANRQAKKIEGMPEGPIAGAVAAEACVLYLIEMAHRMGFSTNISTKDAINLSKEINIRVNEDIESAPINVSLADPALEVLLRTTCLTLDGDNWTFKYPLDRDYFLSLSNDDSKKKSLLKVIREDSYKLKDLFS